MIDIANPVTAASPSSVVVLPVAPRPPAQEAHGPAVGHEEDISGQNTVKTTEPMAAAPPVTAPEANVPAGEPKWEPIPEENMTRVANLEAAVPSASESTDAIPEEEASTQATPVAVESYDFIHSIASDSREAKPFPITRLPFPLDYKSTAEESFYGIIAGHKQLQAQLHSGDITLNEYEHKKHRLLMYG